MLLHDPADTLSKLDSAQRFLERYYSEKARLFGPTPFGVDWTCLATQQMRFVKLLEMCDLHQSTTLNDLGCGYGALLDFLSSECLCEIGGYRGVDLSAEMIKLAKSRNPTAEHLFSVGSSNIVAADYSVASGIFNVKADQSDSDWEDVVDVTLDQIAATSKRGFVVNFVSDTVYRRGLYTTSPDRWASHCERRFRANVEVQADYGLAEFTMLVKPSGSDHPSKLWALSNKGL